MVLEKTMPFYFRLSEFFKFKTTCLRSYPPRVEEETLVK